MSSLTPEIIRFCQRLLNQMYSSGVVEDGILGPETELALLKISAIPTEWNAERKVVALIQHCCMIQQINGGPIDGYLGPQTLYGLEVLQNSLNKLPNDPWRDQEEPHTISSTSNRWPLQRQQDLFDFYGGLGENQTRVKSPYPLRIAWDPSTTITSFSAHQKVAPVIEHILYKVQLHYGKDISALGLDMFGGCLNVRKMRGGTKWSTHSWGISVDWDPARNQLRWGKDKAQLAKPEYNEWWNIWESEGFVSLGRARNYDWMHVQAAQL